MLNLLATNCYFYLTPPSLCSLIHSLFFLFFFHSGSSFIFIFEDLKWLRECHLCVVLKSSFRMNLWLSLSLGFATKGGISAVGSVSSVRDTYFGVYFKHSQYSIYFCTDDRTLHKVISHYYFQECKGIFYRFSQN